MAQKDRASTLKEQLTGAARAAGGSFRTRARREEAAARFHDWLRATNQRQRRIEDVAKVALVAGWIGSIQGDARHKQNELSAIRGVFRAAGFSSFADAKKNRLLSGKALGIAGASRAGAHRPPTEVEWQAIHERLVARPQYVREEVLFRLAKSLGLRVEEAVQSDKSISSWLRQLERGQPVRILYGTKGAKARDVFVPRSLRADAIAAVKDALVLARQHPQGYLISADGLKPALTRVQTVAAAVGLVGEISPHALRCDFAHQFAREALADGYSRAEVLAQLSMSLGHGDGRGRYCRAVYLKGFDWDA